MKLLKILFSSFFFLYSLFAWADNGQLAQQLATLQRELAQLDAALKGIPVAPAVEVPGLPPEMLAALKGVPEAELKEILAYYKKHGYFPPTVPVGVPTPEEPTTAEPEEGAPAEVPVVEETGDGAPPPPPGGPPPPPGGPPPPPGGPPPPPGGPPAPGAPSAPKGIEALTPAEKDLLTGEQRKKSDAYLISLLQPFNKQDKFAIKKLVVQMEEALKKLKTQRAFDQEFRFEKDPEDLKNKVVNYINSNLKLQEGESLKVYLERIYQGIVSDEVQNEFMELFKPWVLGSFKDFESKVKSAAEQLIINEAAKVRSEESTEMTVPGQYSPDATQSDEQFTDVFAESQSLDDLIKGINRLRINPSYYKFMNLQEDIGVAKKEAEEEAEEGAEALMEAIRKRGGKKEVKTEEGIILLLENQNIDAITNDYLLRYLFVPKRFDSVRDSLKTLVASAPKKEAEIGKPKIGEFKKAVVPILDSTEFFDEFIDQISSLKELSNAIGEWTRQDESIKRQKGFQITKPQFRRNIILSINPDQYVNALKDIGAIYSRFKARSVAENKKAIKQLEVFAQKFGKLMSDESIDKLAKLEKSGSLMVRTLDQISGAKSAAEWFDVIDGVLQGKDLVEADRADLLKIRDELWSLYRTPTTVIGAVNETIAEGLPEDRQKTIEGKLKAIVEPYGSLMSIVKFFAEKVRGKKSFDSSDVKIITKLLKSMNQLNEAGAIEEPVEIKAKVGYHVNEDYKGKLVPLIQALENRNTKEFIDVLNGLIMENAQIKQVQDAFDKFKDDVLLDSLTRLILAEIILELTKLNDGEGSIPALPIEGPNLERNIKVYSLLQNMFDKLLPQLKDPMQQDKLIMTPQEIGEITGAIDGITKSINEKIRRELNGAIDVPQKSDIIRKIDEFFNNIKDRFINLPSGNKT